MKCHQLKQEKTLKWSHQDQERENPGKRYHIGLYFLIHDDMIELQWENKEGLQAKLGRFEWKDICLQAKKETKFLD